MLFKRSDKSTQDFDFYTDDSKNAVFLVEEKFRVNEVFSILDKFSITLIDIKPKEKYLNDKISFYNFIRNNKPLLTSYLDVRKNFIISDMKTGEIKNSVKAKNEVDLNFVKYTSSVREIYDEVTQFDTVSDKIVETLKLSFEDYVIWYNNSWGELRQVEFIGLEYLQAYSIYCTPNLMITIYANGYKEPRGYRGSFSEDSLKNLVNNERKLLLNEAQALINMCEERYDEQFSYLRWR